MLYNATTYLDLYFASRFIALHSKAILCVLVDGNDGRHGIGRTGCSADLSAGSHHRTFEDQMYQHIFSIVYSRVNIKVQICMQRRYVCVFFFK